MTSSCCLSMLWYLTRVQALKLHHILFSEVIFPFVKRRLQKLISTLKCNSYLHNVFKKKKKDIISEGANVFVASIHTCLSQAALNRLQLVQNALARLLKWAIGLTLPILASLHWVPVKFRVHYKILLITYMALHDLAPVPFLISSFLIPLPRPLRSSNPSLISVPRSICNNLWGRGDIK